MEIEKNIKLSEIVVLIDAAFLNFVVTDMKKHFEGALQRPLQTIDLSELSTYITLDAGIAEGTNEIQYLLVYDKDSAKLQHCHPSDLKEELNGVAFKNAYGEYLFASVPSEGMVSRSELFLDLLSIVTDSKDVKKIIVISYNEEYGSQVTDHLNEVEGKEIVQFRMTEPDVPLHYTWEVLAFPIMQALGIRAEELG